MKTRLKYFLFFSFWATVILSFFIYGKYQNDEIEKFKAFGTGNIYECWYSGAGRVTLHFTFKVRNKTYLSKNGPTIKTSNFRYFDRKYFPVIYSKIDPDKNYLLVFPDAFEAWKIPFPDSLEWVKQYEKW